MDLVRFDHGRRDRTNILEAVLAEGKRDEELIRSVSQGLERNPFVLVTRCSEDQINLLKEQYTRYVIKGSTAIIGKFTPPTEEPRVGIFAAGTSDMPIVEEVELTLLAHGISSVSWVDIGVAHLQRTIDVLEELSSKKSIEVLVLIAGHEGALFTVVSGMTKLPCIAVPSPRGYGHGGLGETALSSALQSCAPGVVTVNIGNGFGAAAFCVKMLRRGEQ